MTAAELQEFLTLIFYPRETLERLAPTLERSRRRCARSAAACFRQLFELVRILSRRYTLVHATRVFPPDYRELFQELLHEPSGERGPAYYDALIDSLIAHDRALEVIRLTVRVVRNLAIDELVIGGDCWDRGPRGDRVVDYLMRQPNVVVHLGQSRRRLARRLPRPRGADRPRPAHLAPLPPAVAAGGGLRHPRPAAGAPRPHESTPTTRRPASCPRAKDCAID